MFELLVTAESYGERRGAAYGIGSIIKGLGVASIKQMDINSRLKDMLNQKQKPLFKEGALLCIEIFCRFEKKFFYFYWVDDLILRVFIFFGYFFTLFDK
jgi:hypothetical protein